MSKQCGFMRHFCFIGRNLTETRDESMETTSFGDVWVRLKPVMCQTCIALDNDHICPIMIKMIQCLWGEELREKERGNKSIFIAHNSSFNPNRNLLNRPQNKQQGLNWGFLLKEKNINSLLHWYVSSGGPADCADRLITLIFVACHSHLTGEDWWKQIRRFEQPIAA